MRIHKEGYPTLALVLIVLLVVNALVYWQWTHILPTIGGLSLLLFLLFLQFFRHPQRPIPQKDNTLVYAPADGRVVVIEEVEEPEYFKGKRLQVSIFMSAFNVHVNRNPVSGEVKYYHYHPGKYLAAWNPKSSMENERTTLVLDSGKGDILIRQIAGAMARRIVNYLKPGQQVEQGSEMGFIKFGSRVDVLMPLDADIRVDIGQAVRGNQTVLAALI